MGRPRRTSGDRELAALFDEFQGRVVTPSGAAALLGLSRQAVHTMCARGTMRVLRSKATVPRQWTYIPLEDVRTYALRTGRSTAEMERWDRWLPVDDRSV